jgi:hypothetical protein
VGCWVGVGFCARKLEGQGGVPCHLYGVFLHFWGGIGLLECGLLNFFEGFALALDSAGFFGR